MDSDSNSDLDLNPRLLLYPFLGRISIPGLGSESVSDNVNKPLQMIIILKTQICVDFCFETIDLPLVGEGKSGPIEFHYFTFHIWAIPSEFSIPYITCVCFPQAGGPGGMGSNTHCHKSGSKIIGHRHGICEPPMGPRGPTGTHNSPETLGLV